MIRAVLLAVLTSPTVAQITQNLPENLDGLIAALPEPTTPVGALFYAAWGVFGIAGGKKAYSKVRSGKGPAPTVQQHTSQVNSGATSVGSESRAQAAHKPGFGKAVAFKLPAFLPVAEGIREVTTNEVHALELGAIVGFVTLWLLSTGRQEAAFGIALVFVGGSLGYKRVSSKAFKTIRMEPWYALMAFAAGAVAGAMFFDPTLLTQYL